MSSQPDALPEVFISYAHEDKKYKDELVKQLDVLVQVGKISCWHDGELVAGDQWDDKIKEHLSSSNLILLLVSPDFTFSSYIREVEVQKAIERYKAGEALVIPVLVRNIHGWKELPFGELKLGGLQAVPTHDEYTFIKEWPNPDAAFENVAAGIEEAVDRLLAQEVVPPPPVNLPPPPLVDFVERKDREGRYMVKRLIGELSPPNKRLIALTGQGGVGKTTIAAEVVRAMTGIFPGRIVWASAEQRADFNFSTLLDEIATQLGKRELSTLALNRKEEGVRVLLAVSPTMIVLDNFETVHRDEQTPCAEFLLRRAQCPALITTRQRVAIARNIPVDSMSHEEAQEFLERFIPQMQDQQIFTAEVRQRIIETAEARPFVMQWVVAQIDQEAQEPDVVLKELSQGEGDAAERVFDRSFNLPQLGDDGRAALLALSLFVSGATRNALAEVAGFGDDENRLNEAVKSLRALSLIIGKDENQRLAVEGLTRSLAGARLSKDERANEFRQRFVAYFLRYAKAHPKPTPEDYAALEAEKDNLLYAIDVAFNLGDWESVHQITYILAAPVTGVLSVHGYWDEAIRRCEQALKAARNIPSETRVAQFTHNVAVIYQYRGELTEARQLYDESLEIKKRLGDQGGIAITLHNLAAIAQAQGELTEARRLYDESLEIERRLGDQSGIAITLGQLGLLAEEEGNKAEAVRLLREALGIFEKLGSPYAETARRILERLESESS